MAWRDVKTDPPPPNQTQLVRYGGSLYFASCGRWDGWYDVHGHCYMRHAPTEWYDGEGEAESRPLPKISTQERQLTLAL